MVKQEISEYMRETMLCKYDGDCKFKAKLDKAHCSKDYMEVCEDYGTRKEEYRQREEEKE